MRYDSRIERHLDGLNVERGERRFVAALRHGSHSLSGDGPGLRHVGAVIELGGRHGNDRSE